MTTTTTTTNNGATDMNLIDITDLTDAELDALLDDAVAHAAVVEIADAFPAGGAAPDFATFRAEKAATPVRPASGIDLLELFAIAAAG